MADDTANLGRVARERGYLVSRRTVSITPSYCCVPECNQKGHKDEKNIKISHFKFLTTRRKQWLHARRDEGKYFRFTKKT